MPDDRTCHYMSRSTSADQLVHLVEPSAGPDVPKGAVDFNPAVVDVVRLGLIAEPSGDLVSVEWPTAA